MRSLLEILRENVRIAKLDAASAPGGDEKTTVENDCIDLTPFAREDMLLEFPRHPLCKAECNGLKKNGRGKEENSPAAWNELDKLNF